MKKTAIVILIIIAAFGTALAANGRVSDNAGDSCHRLGKGTGYGYLNSSTYQYNHQHRNEQAESGNYHRYSHQQRLRNDREDCEQCGRSVPRQNKENQKLENNNRRKK
ncbi:MAG: hypothetical protein JW784_06390 [Candidatus Cloacimonetes bacterium]|nr:hypothetical protein [Candidatus Cloacimonadota bacterium]